MCHETIDILPETAAWLAEEARKRGQAREMVATLALEAFSAKQREEEAERLLQADWQAASSRSLWEVWDNDDDAICDTPFLPGEETQAWITRLRQITSDSYETAQTDSKIE